MKTKDAWNLLYSLQDAIENADEEGNINMSYITSDLIDAQEFSSFSLDLIDTYLVTVTRITSETYAAGDKYNPEFERSIIKRANELTQKAAKVTTLLETLNEVTDMFNDLLKEG